MKRGQRSHAQWTPDAIAKLGSISDTEIAQQLGITISAVAHKRRGLMIPRWDRIKKRPPVESTPKQVKKTARAKPQPDLEKIRSIIESFRDLMKNYDRAAITKATGISYERLGRIRILLDLGQTRSNARQWTKEEIALLGTDSDIEVGKMLGLPHYTVAKKRINLGIAPGGKKGRRSKSAWAQEAIELLGKIPDTQIARRFGYSLTKIRSKRSELSIPSYNDWKTN